MDWITIFNLVGLVLVFTFGRLAARASKRAGYYQGRHDEMMALEEASSAEDFVFITRAQIAEALGEKEAVSFVESMEIFHVDEEGNEI